MMGINPGVGPRENTESIPEIPTPMAWGWSSRSFRSKRMEVNRWRGTEPSDTSVYSFGCTSSVDTLLTLGLADYAEGVYTLVCSL